VRIILPKELINDKELTISGEKARYLISVLRCNAGDELQVFDDGGSFYKAKVSGIENKKVIIDLIKKVSLDTESPLDLVLVQGILKGEKMDWVIQKTTELGVKEIIPAITERSQVRETRKISRWRKIAEEASKQSGRSIIPMIHEPVEFSSWLMTDSTEHLNGFIFWEEGGLPLKEAVNQMPIHPFTNSPIHLFIGPEGGFSKDEVRLAEHRGLIAASLGKRILRSETAAISAVALAQFLMGDLNNNGESVNW